MAVEKGYIGYKVIAQHRNTWQAIGGVLESKANLTTYCLEVAKQLDMRYISPALPVNLTMKDDDALELPVLSGDSMEDGSGDVGSPGAAGAAPAAQSSRNLQDALSAINTGLRQRKGRSKFADLVKMAMDANRNK